MHWRNHLKFPNQPRVTPEAKDLIRRLLRDVNDRLGSRGSDEIKVMLLTTLSYLRNNLIPQLPLRYLQRHPWFKDVKWDKLYDMEAAYKPEVNGELDTQNFMKYDEVDSHIFPAVSFKIALVPYIRELTVCITNKLYLMPVEYFYFSRYS